MGYDLKVEQDFSPISVSFKITDKKLYEEIIETVKQSKSSGEEVSLASYNLEEEPKKLWRFLDELLFSMAGEKQ